MAKTLNLSEPSKVKDSLENLVMEVRPSPDKDDFSPQTISVHNRNLLDFYFDTMYLVN